MFMLLVGTTSTITSCKKNKETEKEKTLELLTSGKWYYQPRKLAGSSTDADCFTASYFWELKLMVNYEFVLNKAESNCINK